MPKAAAAPEIIEIPSTNQPIAWFFAVVPVITILLIAVTLLRHKLPLALIALLLGLAICCGYLAKEAIANLAPTRLELTQQQLAIKGLLSSAAFPWTQIETIKLVDAGATFGDAGRTEERRAAIALFLRNPDRKETPTDDNPDVLVVSRTGEDALPLVKACERLQAAKRGSTGKGGKLGAPARGEKGFRRTVAA